MASLSYLLSAQASRGLPVDLDALRVRTTTAPADVAFSGPIRGVLPPSGHAHRESRQGDVGVTLFDV
ncbi:MAG: hypothetical protein AAGA73_19585 [Pseudomonadota bacterium]